MVETEGQNISKIVRRLLETRLETSMKKEADKIRKYGKKNRRIGNYFRKCKIWRGNSRKTKNIC